MSPVGLIELLQPTKDRPVLNMHNLFLVVADKKLQTQCLSTYFYTSEQCLHKDELIYIQIVDNSIILLPFLCHF